MPCEKCAEIKIEGFNQDACGAIDSNPNTWANCKQNCDCHEMCYDELSAKHDDSYPEDDINDM